MFYGQTICPDHTQQFFGFSFWFRLVLGLEHRALAIPGKRSSTEQQPQPCVYFLFRDRASLNCLCWPWTCTPPALISWVQETTFLLYYRALHSSRVWKMNDFQLFSSFGKFLKPSGSWVFFFNFALILGKTPWSLHIKSPSGSPIMESHLWRCTRNWKVV